MTLAIGRQRAFPRLPVATQLVLGLLLLALVPSSVAAHEAEGGLDVMPATVEAGTRLRVAGGEATAHEAVSLLAFGAAGQRPWYRSRAVFFSGSSSGGESNNACLNLSNKSISTPVGDHYLLERYPNDAFRLQRFLQDGNPATSLEQEVEAFVSSRDVGGAIVEAFGGMVVVHTSGTCATP